MAYIKRSLEPNHSLIRTETTSQLPAMTEARRMHTTSPTWQASSSTRLSDDECDARLLIRRVPMAWDCFRAILCWLTNPLVTQNVRADSKEQIYEGGHWIFLKETAPCASKRPRKHINESVRKKRHINWCAKFIVRLSNTGLGPFRKFDSEGKGSQ